MLIIDAGIKLTIMSTKSANAQLEISALKNKISWTIEAFNTIYIYLGRWKASIGKLHSDQLKYSKMYSRN